MGSKRKKHIGQENAILFIDNMKMKISIEKAEGKLFNIFMSNDLRKGRAIYFACSTMTLCYIFEKLRAFFKNLNATSIGNTELIYTYNKQKETYTLLTSTNYTSTLSKGKKEKWTKINQKDTIDDAIRLYPKKPKSNNQ